MDHPNLVRGLTLLERIETPSDLLHIWSRFDNSQFNWIEKSLQPWWQI